MQVMSPPTLAYPAHAEQLIELDFSESETAYTIRARMPGGVRRQDIEIAVRGHEILLHAQTCPGKGGFGIAGRSFPLPPLADAPGLEVAFDNGLLTLSLPKRSAIDTSGSKVVVELQPLALHMEPAGA
jgi:HSP20 family protein